MKKRIIFLFALIAFQTVTAQRISDNLIWDSPSDNSSASMPCGGGDIGLNVWVEKGDVLFYFARSDAFDENNSMLKQGRVRIRLFPNPFADGGTFRQELKLEEGAILISGKNKENIATDIRIWVDVFNPVIHVETNNKQKLSAQIFYENWRYQDRLLRKGENLQNSYKWTTGADAQGLSTKKDEVFCEDGNILFYHRNGEETVFDVTVKSQGLESVKELLFNPLKNLTFGGILEAKGFKAGETQQGTYIDTDYKAWKLESKQPLKQWNLTIKLHTAQTDDIAAWKKALEKPLVSNKQKNQDWWKNAQNRSFVHIHSKDGTTKGEEISRNYQLFRYTLACNAYGNYPTKFNGGTFTFDPVFVNKNKAFTPDFRNWAGGTFTAQNQRLSYYPMLKNGDFEWMTPQFEFYKRILQTAELRSKVYWGHGGACFTEQIDNFGLPELSEYAGFPGMPVPRSKDYNPGVDYNPWLEYLWDCALEFSFMILEKERYTGANISEYLPLVESSVRFFDEHYQYLAKQRGVRVLDGNGKLILYPGSGCENYKMTSNSSSTIAALQTVASRLLELPAQYLDSAKRTYYEQFLKRVPEIHTREVNGRTVIAPAWQWERNDNNGECPQLYPVFPWGIYGLDRPNLETAINTYLYDPLIANRSHIGWHQEAIWAARLGLTDEAKMWVVKKLQDAETRFPAFWGSDFNWIPDNDWGGTGSIALQEMLLQADGKKLFLLPAWPKDWDVHFKLYAPYNTTVECTLEDGVIKYLDVQPKSREKDVIHKL